MLLSNLALLIAITAPSFQGPDDTTFDTTLDPGAARLAAAREAYSRRELGVAHDLLRSALEQAPGEPALRLWLARVLNDLGRGAEAAGVLGPALADNDGSAWLWSELGRAWRIAGDREQAERALRAALARSPNCGPPRLMLVELLLDAGRVADAEPVLAPLLQRSKNTLPVVLAHASLLEAQGQAEPARARLRAVIEHPAARLALTRNLVRSERPKEAWTAAQPLLDNLRDPTSLVFLAQVARAAGHDLEALSILGAALVTDPGYPDALGAMNELLEHRAPQLRRSLTERWIAARPADVNAWRELLETDLDAGRFAAFFTELERVPPDLRPAVPVRLLEGEALRRSGRTAEARALLEALCKNSGPARAWYELGLLNYAAGDPEAAAGNFERGAASTWAADAHFNRGVCLDRLGRYSAAALAYQAATEARPGFSQAWLQLGADQRHRLGQPQRARQSYARYLALGGDDPEVRRFVEDER
jgi:tetratricopeptide (TPR) repeat protein